MILPDTSAWIDYFADRMTVPALALDRALDSQLEVAVGDLVMVEVLQGVRSESDLQRVRSFLGKLTQVSLCGPTVAVSAAANYRALRRRGITVRGTIDVIIATWCIENDAAIIHNDRDLLAMETHLGLRAYA